MRILLVDHEDSFVHNIEQALRQEGAEVLCLRSTVPLGQAIAFDPDGVVLSPGPGHPRDPRRTRLSRSLLARWEAERPFFGVCLGHQVIADRYGAAIERAEEPVHGETTRLWHDGQGVFHGVPTPTVGARYHSLVVRPGSVPTSLTVSARGERQVVMGLRHRRLPVESVQFHPESYLTPHGRRMLANFLGEVRR
jgi:para-aminobenzoate synthetase component II